MNWLKKLWKLLFPYPFKTGSAGPILWMNKIKWVDGAGNQQTSYFENNGVGVLNPAVNNICVLAGLYQPIYNNPVWSVDLSIEGNSYPVTLMEGDWTCSIPVGVFASNSLATVTLVASCNGKPVLGLEPYGITFGEY